MPDDVKGLEEYTLHGGELGGSLLVATGHPIGWVIMGGFMAYSFLKPILWKKKPSFTYDVVRLDNTALQDIPIPIVYGNCKVAGNIIYDSGTHGRLRNYLVGLSEGEILSADQFVANGEYLQNTRTSYTLGTSVAGYYRVHCGKDPGIGDPDLDDFIINPSTHRRYSSVEEKAELVGSLKHIAYVAICLQKKQSNPTIVCNNIYGRKVEYWNGSIWTNDYDLLDWDDKVAYIQNPAYCIRDILKNTRYGADISSSSIDDTSFQEAGEYFHEKITTTDRRYGLNLVIDQRRNITDVLDEILSTCGAFFVWSQGKLKLKVAKANETITKYFTMDNIVADSFSFQKLDSDDIPNRIKIEYTDHSKVNRKGYVWDEDEDDIAANGLKEEEVLLRGVTSSYQARRLAHLYLLQSRRCDVACRFSAGIDAIRCEVGNVIAISHDVPGWNKKPFRIITIDETETDERIMTLSEYDSNIYTDDVGIEDPEMTYSILEDPGGVPDTLTSFKVITNYDELSNYPISLQREVIGELKNYYDPDSGENLAPVVLIDFELDTSNVKRIDAVNILPFDFMGTKDQLTGTGTCQPGQYFVSNQNWETLYGGSLKGQYMILFSSSDDDGKAYKIKSYLDFGSDTLVTFTENPDTNLSGRWFVVNKKDIDSIIG